MAVSHREKLFGLCCGTAAVASLVTPDLRTWWIAGPLWTASAVFGWRYLFERGPDEKGNDSSASGKAIKAATKLADLRNHAINSLQNRAVGSRDDQDVLDSDRKKWMGEIVNIAMEGGASPSNLTRLQTIGTYTSKNLPPLVAPPAVGDVKLAVQNANHRNEVAERVDRLEHVIRELESKP